MKEFFENERAVRNLYFAIGCLVFGALLYMAGLMYMERVCTVDTAYRTVLMIITGRPAIYILRFSAFIPQLFPLLAIWLHTSLKTVMVVNSLSFVIYFFLIYIVAFRFSKSSLLFFLIPVYLIMLTNEEFYWPQSEYQQGMVWLCFYALFLFEQRDENISPMRFFIVHGVWMLWLQIFHVLMFVPLSFLIVYFYYSRSSLFSKRFYIHQGICTIIFIINWILGVNDPYEKGKLNIGKSFQQHLPHLFSMGSVHEFWHKLPVAYAGYSLVFLLSLGWFVYRKKHLMAVALIAASGFYWLLVIMACPDEGRFYSEYLMLPLGFMAALPFITEILPMIQSPYTIALIVLFCAARIGLIYHSHADYTKRLEIYQPYFDYIKKEKLNGVFVDNKLIDQKKAIMTWASGYESVLISSLRSPDSTMVVQILNDPNSLSWGLNMDTSMVTIYGTWGKNELPTRYFKLQGGKYEILTKQP